MKTIFTLALSFLLVSGFYFSHHHAQAATLAQQIEIVGPPLGGTGYTLRAASPGPTNTAASHIQVAEAMNPRRVLTRIIGTDEHRRSAEFHVDSPHWWITCSSKRIDRGMTLQVLAVPRAAGKTLVALNLTRDGFATTSVNNPGDWHLEVLGFACAWEVTVEEEIP